MALLQTQTVTQKQTQSLTLTPQMVQALRILHASHTELGEILEEEVKQNPLLELDFSRKSLGVSDDILLYKSETPNLQAILRQALLSTLKTKGDKAIAEVLIYSLNEAGFLSDSLEVLADDNDFEIEDCEAVLELLQNNAPILGIGARDLKECLALQTKDPQVLKLLDHLELVAKRDFKGLMTLLHLSQEEVIKTIDALKALNPKPALGFNVEHLNPPEPDILVFKNKEGVWEARLNAEIQPKITINSRLRQQLTTSKDKEAQTWGKTLTHNAAALFKMMGNRHETLLKVATEIVKVQSDYFESGSIAMKPLTLKQVADSTGFHESTISRAISHKALLSDKGMVELKFFFSASLGNEGSSSEAIKSRIKTLIEGETKAYSDDKLVELLLLEGVHVARRTVTKYRESMNIASSVMRNRDKMFA